MQCPVDNETLVMADRNGVEIDYCPKCRGVWLDRGELDKIIDRAAGAPAAAPTPQAAPRPRGDVNPVYQPEPRYRDDDDHRYSGGHKKKRREGFLGELFDF
ncbi:MAG: zf-TFIIB domain-containing protein [Pseudomonadota bacterium]